MRLIGVASLVDGIKDRHTSLQQSKRLSRPFDLKHGAVRQPGCP